MILFNKDYSRHHKPFIKPRGNYSPAGLFLFVISYNRHSQDDGSPSNSGRNWAPQDTRGHHHQKQHRPANSVFLGVFFFLLKTHYNTSKKPYKKPSIFSIYKTFIIIYLFISIFEKVFILKILTHILYLNFCFYRKLRGNRKPKKN